MTKALDYLRLKGPMSKSDLNRLGHIDDKVMRDTLVELFAVEDLARVDGKMVTATTFEEFVSGLYSRKEFPEPVKHWTGATGKADAA